MVVKNDPRQEVDESNVGCEEGHDVGRVQHAQGVHVHPIGAHPKETKEAAPTHERSCNYKSHKFVFYNKLAIKLYLWD